MMLQKGGREEEEEEEEAEAEKTLPNIPCYAFTVWDFALK